MSQFSQWPTLNQCLSEGSFQIIDLAFAKSVLKKITRDNEADAAMLCALFALSSQGHLCLDLDHLPFASSLLKIQNAETFSALVQKALLEPPWVFRLGNCCYLQRNWICESTILFNLERLRKTPPALAFSVWTPSPLLNLNIAQTQAVVNGMQNSVSFLTGGPGTGKTFTAAELVKACLSCLNLKERSQFRIILTAPTGKAVAQLEANIKKTIQEKINVRTGTLHAILEAHPHRFGEEEIIPIFADLIIVDECSMIDAEIFSKLLSAVRPGTRLIFIGDVAQLPPVGAGSIFADLLDIYPATKLETSLRSDRHEILQLAWFVKEGKAQEAIEWMLENKQISLTDLEEEMDPVQLCANLWMKYKNRFPSHSLEKPSPKKILGELGGFSLLSSMRQGLLGVDAINRYFLNQSLKEACVGTWWIAPIMITRNDYGLDVYNGDLGLLMRKITHNFSLNQFQIDDYALFDDRQGSFKQIAALALSSFEYSYCLSVHKSQGSEYAEVLILMPKGSELFGREVLYTAITRAKDRVFLVGSEKLLRHAIEFSSRKRSGIRSTGIPIKISPF